MNEEDEKDYERNRRQNRPDLQPTDFVERFKANKLGSESIDNMMTGLANDWQQLSPDTRNIIAVGAKSLVDTYQDIRTVDQEERRTLDPIEKVNAYATAGITRGFELTGDLIDFTFGNIGRGAANLAGLDPRLGEVAALGTSIYGTAKAPQMLKAFSKTQAAKNMAMDAGMTMGAQYRTGKELIKDATKGLKKGKQLYTEKFSKDPSQRVINVVAEAVDSTEPSFRDVYTLAQRINSKTSIGMQKSIKEAKILIGIRNKGLLTGLDPKKDYEMVVQQQKQQEPQSWLGPVQDGGPNYSSIEGPDLDSAAINNQWLAARTGKPYHFDISGHRIFEVPGMQNTKEAKRYKDWLTNSLVQRFKDQTVVPDKQITFFHSNKDFIDSKGNPWQLVRANKRAKGPNQTYVPTPKVEVDSRKMKKQNTNNEEKVLLAALMRQNVSQRNSFEKRYPWLREWISESTGENYHEHMFGLDETEFWKSGYGKSLGYMNNDVYDLEKGLGNIVFLQDPRFKKMKDAAAEFITPGKKIQIYPGLKRREGAVQRFKAGPYKDLNAIIGYDANPTSKTFTDLTIYAYNPDPNINFGIRVATMPNYYSIVFAKDQSGRRILSDESAKLFVNQYIEAVLNGDQPKIVALTDLASVLAKQYPNLVRPGTDYQLPAPSGLNLDIDYRTAGAYSEKKVDPDPLREKEFITTPKNQRKFDRDWKKLLIRIKKGKYKQLDLLNLLFPTDGKSPSLKDIKKENPLL